MCYGRWAELYWKKQIGGNLTEEEQKESERLKIEEHGTIEELIILWKIKRSPEMVEKIKSHG